MRTMKYIAITAVSTCTVAILAACGGGGDGSVPIAYVPGTEVPVGVQTEVGQVLSFGQQQIASNTNDTSDPLLLGDDTTLAVSESDDAADI